MQRRFLPLLVVTCVVGALATGTSYALPAFARREGVACQMCHFRVPELNEDGRAYLRRGLREAPGVGMAESAAPAATAQPLGVPMAIDWAKYISVMGLHEFSAQKGAHSEFNAGEVDLWAAGPFDTRWSAVANPIFDIQNGGSDVDQGYAQYITRWSQRFGSARLGQMLPFAILLNGADPSMPLSAPVVLTATPDNGSTWAPNSFLRGVEVGYVNSPKWNGYVGAAQPRVDLGSSVGFQEHTDLYASGEYIVNPKGDSFSVYGYRGHSWLSTDATNQAFHRIGLFGNIYLPKVKGTAGYLKGKDKTDEGVSLDNSGYFVQPEYLLNDRVAIYGRYDHFKQDLSAGGSQTTKGPTLGATLWAATPVRLTLEAQFLKTTGQPAGRSVTAQLLWVF